MNCVEVHYLQPLTGIFSKRSESIEVRRGTTLADLLETIFSTYQEQFEKHDIDPTSKHIVIMLNGRTVSSEKRNIELCDKDSLVFCMPVAGG